MNAKRVLMLGTYARRGGAGIAARRLQIGLRRAGHDALLLAGDVDDAASDGFVAAGDRVPSADDVLFAALQHQGVDARRTPVSNTLFTLGFDGVPLDEHPTVASADVLHLHWVSGLLSIDSIARLLRRPAPVVWTFHDMWSMTGGCHYSAGCEGFVGACRDCPQLQPQSRDLPAWRLDDRRREWAGRLPHVVTPTRWMQAAAARSTLFRDAPATVIPNGIDLAEFAPTERAAARHALGLPAEGVYLLFVAESHGEKRKGYAELLSAIELLGDALDATSGRPLVRLLSLGDTRGMPPSVRVESIALGASSDPVRLRHAYCAADAFVLPSLEDNLPNTLLEAMACGRPVVAFDAGGAPEAIVDGETGVLVPAADTRALMEALLALCNDAARRETMGVAARARAEREYSLELCVQRHDRLYDELLAARGQRDAESGVDAGRSAARWRAERADRLLDAAAGDLRDCLTQLAEAHADRIARGTQIDELTRIARSFEHEAAARLALLQQGERDQRRLQAQASQGELDLRHALTRLQDVEADRAERARQIDALTQLARQFEHEAAARLELLHKGEQELRETQARLREAEADRAARGVQIEALTQLARRFEQDSAARLALLQQAEVDMTATQQRLAEADADRVARGAQVDQLNQLCRRLETDIARLQETSRIDAEQIRALEHDNADLRYLLEKEGAAVRELAEAMRAAHGLLSQPVVRALLGTTRRRDLAALEARRSAWTKPE